MHPNKTRNQFIQIRAQGWSIARIASHLRVSKNTLLDWNRIYAEEIGNLRRLEREAIYEKVLASHHADLDRLAKLHDAVEHELASRKLSDIPTDKLFRLAAVLRDQINDAHANSRLLEDQKPHVPDRLTREERFQRNLDLVRAFRGLPSSGSDPDPVQEQPTSDPPTPPLSSETALSWSPPSKPVQKRSTNGPEAYHPSHSSYHPKSRLFGLLDNASLEP